MIYSEVQGVIEFHPVSGTWKCLLNVNTIINHTISRNIPTNLFANVHSGSTRMLMNITNALFFI